MFEKEEGADGDITGFGALCTELAATLGTGNIIGVAAAIKLGVRVRFFGWLLPPFL